MRLTLLFIALVSMLYQNILHPPVVKEYEITTSQVNSKGLEWVCETDFQNKIEELFCVDLLLLDDENSDEYFLNDVWGYLELTSQTFEEEDDKVPINFVSSRGHQIYLTNLMAFSIHQN